MKINNDLLGKLFGNNANTLELQKNQTYNAHIKERLPNNQAMVQIRGKEFKVKFEDNLPKENRAFIQVTNKKDDSIFVKNAKMDDTVKTDENNISKLISKLGMKPTSELKKAVKTLISNGIPVTKETLKNLENFVSKSEGDISEKLDTIERMAQKGIEFTPSNLEAVHEALHSDDLQSLLSEVGQRIDSEAISNVSNNQYRDVINEIRELLTNGEDIDKILEIIEDKIMDKGIEGELAKAVNMAKYLKGMGYEKEGIEKIFQVLEQLEGQQQYDNTGISEASSQEPSSKAFVMTKVSERMASVSEKFTDLKRAVIRNIDTMTQVVKDEKGSVHSNVKGLLEKTIDTIDKAILKSDITLFADMKTERELLGLSSKLAEARRYLSKGQNDQATKVLDEVKSKLMKLRLRPSENKVIHGATKESLFSKNAPAQGKSLPNLINSVNNHQNQQPTARNVFDLFRALGLNYESEVAQRLAGNPEETTKQDIQKNIKAMLLKLAKGEGKGFKDSSANQSVVKSLNNLTGQQLLSKQDDNPHQQNMFFNIPINVDGNLHNVKLFVNGRRQNEKIDWENSSLYFLIETDRMGPTGIQISSTERNLSVTIKNDKKELENKITPLSDRLKDKLEEIGYNVVGLNFAELNNNTEKENKKKTTSKAFIIPDRLNEKGFDFKI